MDKTIGFVYDLRKDYLAEGYSCEQVAEFDSEETIIALAEAIASLGYSVERIGNGRQLAKLLAEGRRWDLVFNIAEGLAGRNREAQVPALLEMYDISYTFSDALVCAVTLDKGFAKRVVQSAGLATAGFCVIEDGSELQNISLEYPLFAKPVAEGTGKGIDGDSLVSSRRQLEQVVGRLLKLHNQPVLVEEFLPGREFTVGIVGNGAGARVLGIMEITIPGDNSTIYSFQAKEKCESLVKYLPYRGGALFGELSELALASYRVLQCRDAARVDLRCDGKGRLCFLEINPLPGLHPTHSDLPMIATQEGMSYRQLIGAIIESALERSSRPL